MSVRRFVLLAICGPITNDYTTAGDEWSVTKAPVTGVQSAGI
jgi:hypothetical protein